MECSCAAQERSYNAQCRRYGIPTRNSIAPLSLSSPPHLPKQSRPCGGRLLIWPSLRALPEARPLEISIFPGVVQHQNQNIWSKEYNQNMLNWAHLAAPPRVPSSLGTPPQVPISTNNSAKTPPKVPSSDHFLVLFLPAAKRAGL